MEIRKVTISPESLKYDIINETYDGYNFGVYSGMSQILKAGPNDTSLLTGLTIPVLLKQDYQDIGFYSVTDGNVGQLDTDLNFVFTSSTQNPYTYNFYITTANKKKYLNRTVYSINWGDGSPVQTVQGVAPSYTTHTYTQPISTTSYTVSLIAYNQIGTFFVNKTINIPYTDVSFQNPYGTVEWVGLPQGSWDTIPQYQNYIYSSETNSSLSVQTGSTFIDIPFIISGYSQSQLFQLESYGPVKFPANNQQKTLSDGTKGQVVSFSPQMSSYTINNLLYMDFSGGSTVYVVYSSGLTEHTIIASAITKNEVYMNMWDLPQVQVSGVIERGKNSGMEKFIRIGEVDSIGDIVNYGYKFFNVQRIDT
jgi:hypothetical protein